MSEAAPRPISNAVKWTICAVAAMGFLFDIYVVLVGPLILQPALTELGHLRPGKPEYRELSGRPFRPPPHPHLQHSRVRLLRHGFRTGGGRVIVGVLAHQPSCLALDLFFRENEAIISG